MIRNKPKEPYKGLKRTPMKRKSPMVVYGVKRTGMSMMATALSVESIKKPPKKRSGLKIRIDPLDQLFSEYIRKRAVQRVGGCEHCLKPYRWQDLECAHFFGRRDKSTRWDEDNCIGLCFYCHKPYFHAHPLEFTRWFEKYLGSEKLELLECRHRILRMPDKKVIELYLKAEITKLPIDFST